MKVSRVQHSLIRLILVMVVIFVISGAASAQDNVLRVGMEAPVVLDPALGSNDPETALNRAIYDYLIEVAPDSSIVPNLATDWTISDDGLTYTFTLAEGVTFHDGSPFTSADVVYTYNRLKELESSALALLGDFEISAPDEQTVVFTIPEANADFLYGVASRFALILKDGTESPNTIGEGDDPYASFNGTGPFLLESFDPNVGGRAVFVKNDNYWKEGQPLLDGMEHVYFSGEAVTAFDAVTTGEVDFIYKVPTSLVADGVAEGLSVIEQPTSQHGVIRLRTDVGPGTDPLVRQAFKYATDRQQLNDILLLGRGTIGNNDPIAPAYGVYYADDIETQTYDPEEARRLLEEAGYPDGLEMTLYVPTAFEYVEMATLLQQQWMQAGINVTIDQRDAGLYYDTSNDINYCNVELGITGWGDRPVPQLFLLEAYVTSAIAEDCIGGFNETRLSNPELDALVEEAGVTTDTEARADIYRQIAEIFNEEGPIIVPYFANMIGVASNRVQNLTMAPFPGLTDYRNVSLAS
ncbi:MAG: hypothetical protein CL610_04140 [Anaerolineaceae bacterium]|nr:hypothetical protein [Anaerolineaceae bacterium]